MPIIEPRDCDAFYGSPKFQSDFPLWSIPSFIREPVVEVSTTFKVPVELCVQAALGTISLVCQPFINVQCPPYDPAPPSLYLTSILKSSGGKSIVEQRFLRPVMAFEYAQEEKFEVAMMEYRAEINIWEDDKRRLTKEYSKTKQSSVEAQDIRARRQQHEKDRPIEPRKLELRFAAMSPEGLRDALVANSVAAIFSPDAGPALLGNTFSQPATFSGYWSAEDRPVGLVGGNRRPVMPHLTIALMTQEDRFAAYMKIRGAEAFGTGLIGRTLFVFPKTVDNPGELTETEDRPEPKLDVFNQRAGDILNQAMPEPRERRTLKLSEEAKRYWRWFKEWVNNELICGDFSEDIKSFFRKIGQNATRIAALLHYFSGADGDISADAMKSAIALCEWYLSEFIQIFKPYAPSSQQKNADAAQQLLHWLQEMLNQPWKHPKLTVGRYTERDLRNYAIRNDPGKLDIAINMLHAQGQIRLQNGVKGGRVIFYPAWQPTPPSLPISNFLGVPMSWPFAAPIFQAQSQNKEECQMPNQDATVGNIGASQRKQVPLVQTDEHFNQHGFEESEQLQAVRQDLQKSAAESGVGTVKLSVYHRRG